jgi:hypothetical protein
MPNIFFQIVVRDSSLVAVYSCASPLSHAGKLCIRRDAALYESMRVRAFDE